MTLTPNQFRAVVKRGIETNDDRKPVACLSFLLILAACLWMLAATCIR